MKRKLFLLTLFIPAACSDAPLEPLDLQPQFATVVGSSATWAFKGVVTEVFPGSSYALGDTVPGSVTFTVTSEDLDPDPCRGYRQLALSFTYALDGETHSTSGDGAAYSRASCSVTGPMRIYINLGTGWGSNFEEWDLFLVNPDDTDDLPLTPPPVDPHYPHTFRRYGNPGDGVLYGFSTELFALTLPDPQTREDCMAGGWEPYGFRNQGQCVRYVETGKDSR